MALPIVLWAAAEPEHFDGSNVVPINDVQITTTSTYFDPDFSPLAVLLDSAQYLTADTTASAEITLHFALWVNSNGSSVDASNVYLYAGGEPVFEWSNTNGVAQLYYYPDNVRTAFGSTFSISVTSLMQVDVYVNLDAANGTIEFYIDEVLIQSVTGVRTTPTTGTQVDGLRIGARGTGSTYDDYLSEFCVFAGKVVGGRVYTALVTTDGTYSQLTGGAPDIDEADIDINTYLTTDTADLKSSFNTALALSGLPVDYDLLQPAAVVTRIYARQGGAGIGGIQQFIRSGGVDYNDSTIALTTGYLSYERIMATNPATASAWTRSGVDAIEVGVESKA